VDTLEKIWDESAVTQSANPATCLDRLRKSHEKSQDSRCPDRDSNRLPSEYKSIVLATAIFPVTIEYTSYVITSGGYS
jgi:hypothetical protein